MEGRTSSLVDTREQNMADFDRRTGTGTGGCYLLECRGSVGGENGSAVMVGNLVFAFVHFAVDCDGTGPGDATYSEPQEETGGYQFDVGRSIYGGDVVGGFDVDALRFVADGRTDDGGGLSDDGGSVQ